MRLLFLFTALWVGCCPGFAQGTGWNTAQSIELSRTGVRSVGASAGTVPSSDFLRLTGRTVGSGAAEGSVLMRELLQKAPSPAGGTFAAGEIAATRVLPWAAIARGVARAAPIVGTALVIKDLMDPLVGLRCKADAGSWVCDYGQPEQTVGAWKYGAGTSSLSYTSVAGYLAAAYPCNGADIGLSCSAWSVQTGTEGTCGVPAVGVVPCRVDVASRRESTWSNPTGIVVTYGVQAAFVSVVQCPSVLVSGVSVVPVKGPDGKCPSTTYAPKSEDEVAARVESFGSKARAPLMVPELLAGNVPIAHDVPSVIGPSAVAGPPVVSVSPTPGAPAVSSPTQIPIVYRSPPDVGYDWGEPAPGAVGSGGTGTGTGSGGSSPGSGTGSGSVTLKTCGLPDTPACKIDESGTPGYVPPDTSGLPSPAADAAARAAAVATVQDPGFGWLEVPAFAACTPIDYPNNMGQLNPCGVVDLVRSIMAYLWVLFGTWWSFGVVRRTVTGG